MRTFILLVTLSFLASNSIGQKKLPIVRAGSSSVNIRENGVLQINRWTVSPGISPDVYHSTYAGKKTHIHHG
jgi:hypothetical protein